MPLTVAERKHRFPHGAGKEIAIEAGVSEALVSRILGGSFLPTTPKGRATERRIQVRIARKLGMKVDDVFPPKTEPAAAEASAA
jgi:hypothetical protein